MKPLASLAAAGILSLAATAAQAVVIFDISATGPFTDPFAILPFFDGGTLTGTFEVDDLNLNGLVEEGEIGPWTITSAGFTEAAYNFTIAGAFATADATGAVFVGAGLSIGLVGFTSGDYTVDFDYVLGTIGPAPEVRLSYLNDLNFALPASPTFSLTPQGQPPAAPAPATLLLLLGGLGLALRRRAAHAC